MKSPETQNRPVISLAIGPKAGIDFPSLIQALDNIVHEDPGVRILSSYVDGQVILGGMDELHLELICDRILQRYGIPLEVGEPSVIYLETIRKPAEGEGKYIRQAGGSGNYGHVKICIEPNQRGEGLEVINEIKGGVVPAEFIEPVEAGIRDARLGGVLAGYELVDVKVMLVDGSFHSVMSNEMAFKIAGSMAFKEAAREAAPNVLEPFMSIDIVVNPELLAAVLGDLNNRRGRIDTITHDAGLEVVHAVAPLSEMLSSSRYGRPAYSMRFARYDWAHRPEPGQGAVGVVANKPKRPDSGAGSIARPIAER